MRARDERGQERGDRRDRQHDGADRRQRGEEPRDPRDRGDEPGDDRHRVRERHVEALRRHDVPEGEPRVQDQRERAGASPPRRPGARIAGDGAPVAPRPAVTGHKAYAASPYRATTVTWSKIIGIGARRAPVAGARGLSYANFRGLPALPCSTIYRNGCRTSSSGCAARQGSPTTNIQDALREVRLALLEADVALPVVKDFVAAVKDKAVGEEVIGSLTPGQALIGVVHRELAALMGGAAAPLDFAVQPPAVILLAGLQGAGKTTTAAKLAHLLRGQKKKVLLVSADVYRPAAIEQLAVLGGAGRRGRVSVGDRRDSRSRSRRRRSTGRSGTTTTC